MKIFSIVKRLTDQVAKNMQSSVPAFKRLCLVFLASVLFHRIIFELSMDERAYFALSHSSGLHMHPLMLLVILLMTFWILNCRNFTGKHENLNRNTVLASCFAIFFMLVAASFASSALFELVITLDDPTISVTLANVLLQTGYDILTVLIPLPIFFILFFQKSFLRKHIRSLLIFLSLFILFFVLRISEVFLYPIISPFYIRSIAMLVAPLPGSATELFDLHTVFYRSFGAYISPACIGMNFMFLIISFFVFLSQTPIVKSISSRSILFHLAASIALIPVLNILRITILVILGATSLPSPILWTYHQIAGVALFLIIIFWILKRFRVNCGIIATK